MRAIILAGGYGSRLAPLTLRLPKSLVPVAGESVLAHLLKMTADTHVSSVVISLNNNQKLIEQTFGANAFGIPLTYHYEESRSDADKPGAIGALAGLVGALGAEESFVLGADNAVYGLDLRKMSEFHHSRKAKATLAFYELDNPRLVELYGIAKLEKDGRVGAFQEKPKASEAFSNLASTAVYLLSPEFLEADLPGYVKAGHSRDRLGDLWNHFVGKIPLYGFPFHGLWGDANSSESYVHLNRRVMEYLKSGSVKSAVPKEAVVEKHVLSGKNCSFGPGSLVSSYSCLGDNCHLGGKAKVMSSILFDNVRVGEGSKVDESILDSKVVVGKNCLVEKFSILGEGVVLGDNVRVLSGARVWPFKKIRSGEVVEGVLS
ncbi:NDP-sugar synthase [Candidatus Micrarchaeota archaeon]|nr:NDP-sugar synthase [Candidatus Micrarchaeota archaeon]